MSVLGKKILESKALNYSKGIKESTKLNEDDRDESYARYNEYLRKMKENPTYQQVESLCKQYGYELHHATAETRSGGNKYIELAIREDRKTYHPDIYFSSLNFGKYEPRFSIQTIGYGSLDLEKYTLFLKGCQDAYDLVSALQEVDLNTLYDPSVDYAEG